MNRRLPLCLPLVLIFALEVASSAGDRQLFLLPNPLQGTDPRDGFSHGATYPAIALPFPVHTWAPYTEPQDNSLFYQYRHQRILGIRQTHEPSMWIRDHATFALMPVSGRLVVTEADRASTFAHTNEIAQPSYYKVYLDTWKTTAEVTPTERAARFRFTFDSSSSTNAFVVLDVFKSGQQFRSK